jgi:hypothetical protein
MFFRIPNGSAKRDYIAEVARATHQNVVQFWWTMMLLSASRASMRYLWHLIYGKIMSVMCDVVLRNGKVHRLDRAELRFAGQALVSSPPTCCEAMYMATYVVIEA